MPTNAPIPSPTFDVQNLSDEFTCAVAGGTCTVQDNGWTEQYPDRYDTPPVIADDQLTISPGVSFNDNVWYDNRHGGMLSKMLPAGQGFAVETLVNTVLVDDPDAVPNDNWNVGGLVMRSTADNGDWVVFNLGLQGAFPGFGLIVTPGIEAKSTTDAVSTFNYNRMPEGTTGPTMTARLRLCRVGAAIRFLYRFVDFETDWTDIHPLNYPSAEVGQEDNLDRPDLTGEVEVGIMTNNMGFGSDGDPFVATFEYIRFGALASMVDCAGVDLAPPGTPSPVGSPDTPAPSGSPTTADPTQVRCDADLTCLDSTFLHQSDQCALQPFVLLSRRPFRPPSRPRQPTSTQTKLASRRPPAPHTRALRILRRPQVFQCCTGAILF